MKLVKVRFIRDAVYRVHGYAHPDNPVFKAGSTHDLRQDLAERWLKRGAAEYVKDKANDARNVVPAAAAEAAPKADSLDGGDVKEADKRNARKAVARDN